MNCLIIFIIIEYVILISYLILIQYQFWTKLQNPEQEKKMFENLFQMGFLVSNPIHLSNSTQTFWSCFWCTLNDNKKTRDGKHRILSIIANNFTYEELEDNLAVKRILW